MADGVRFKCIFCDGWCDAYASGEVMHTMPACQTFLDTDVLDYVQANREHYQRESVANEKKES